jgi:hypothetical protein
VIPLSPFEAIEPLFVSPDRDRVLARGDLAWASGEVDGLRYRWLTPASWRKIARLPPPDDSGFLPLQGYIDEATEATAMLLYSRAGFGFDPGDFMETVRGPGFSRGTAYVRDGVASAERLGADRGRLAAMAVHVQYPAVFLVSVQAKTGDDEARLTARGVVNLLEIQPAPAPVAEEQVSALTGMGLATFVPRDTVTQSDGNLWRARVRLREGPCLLSVRRVEAAPTAANETSFVESALADYPESALRAVRRGTIEPSRNLLGQEIKVICGQLDDRRECSVAWAPHGERATLVFSAVHASLGASMNGWLLSRFVARRALAALRVAT